MMAVVKLLVSLSVMIMMVSCTSSYEGKGNAAYNAAKNAKGDQKKIQLKTAYINFDKAVKANPQKISTKLRNRYIEMTLVRAGMVINEGAVHMDAIPLFLEDVKKLMTADVLPDLKQQFALFYTQMADSSLQKGNIDDARSLIDSALAYANDQAPVRAKKKELLDSQADENYTQAEVAYANGATNKDAREYVTAEFYALTALLFDSSHAKTKELLSKLRKENLSSYSAYESVIDPIPDKALFKLVNKWDILLALPVRENRGGTIRTVINLYNYSWNPLRLKSEHFFLVDVKGKRYKAMPERLEPEMLDQQHEAKLKMSFPKPGAEIAKLIYENGEHYSEKAFF